MNWQKTAALSVLILAGATSAIHGDTVTYSAAPLSANLYPVGGSDGHGPGTRYQQVYNPVRFPSQPVLITAITFPHNHLPGGDIRPGTYSIHLSTTPRPVNGLDTVNFDGNVGSDDQVFLTTALGGPLPRTTPLVLTGEPFLYNPAAGNLLIDISAPGGSFGVGVFLDSCNGTFGDLSSRAQNFGAGFESYGLITTFTFTRQQPVPEPAALALMAAGLIPLVCYGWRRSPYHFTQAGPP